MNCRTRQVLIRGSIGCGIVSLILIALLFYALIFGPDKHEITEYKQVIINREFRLVGLDKVPKHAKYAGGGYIDGIHGSWGFRADKNAMRRWLSTSVSLKTAAVTRKPNRQSFIFYTPASHRACLVIVSFAPEGNSSVDDSMATACIEIVEIGVKKRNSSREMVEIKNAKEAFDDLSNYLEVNPYWTDEPSNGGDKGST